MKNQFKKGPIRECSRCGKILKVSAFDSKEKGLINVVEKVCRKCVKEIRKCEEKLEKERLKKERLEEKERLKKERLEKERLKKERLEKERIEKERLKKDRLEKKRLEKERLEKERLKKKEMRKVSNLNPRVGTGNGKRWTKQEDEMLLSGVKRYGVPHWKKISTLVTGKDNVRSLSSNVQSIHDRKINRKIKKTDSMSNSFDEISRSEHQ